MADTDRSAKFEKISDSANAATAELKAASQRSKGQLEIDVASARDEAIAAADQFKDKAAAARSSQWDEVRGTWQTHVAKVRADVKEKKVKFHAKEAAEDADRAEAYALDAIDFAQTTIEEAEYAALDTLYARAQAVALSS
jgi:hypothetical protein